MNPCNACGALVEDDDEFEARDGCCADCDGERMDPDRMAVEAEQANLRG